MCSPSSVPGLGRTRRRAVAFVVIQWWVWCQGVVGRWGWGSGGWSVCGWVGGVGGVEVGVEGQGVVGVAEQGADGVVVGLAEGFGDGVGEQRVRADLDERGMFGGRRW